MANSIFQILCYFTVVSFVGSTVTECRDGGLIPDEIRIRGCESDLNLCKIKSNGNINIMITFRAPRYLESVIPRLIAKTDFGELNLTQLPRKVDKCSGVLNTVCPIVPNEVVRYEYSEKLGLIPLLPVTLEFSIVDRESNDNIICFDLDVFTEEQYDRKA